MKISVIIPTYNEASVIHDTLEDLFTYHQPDEVIVVDGGSQDQTVAIASEWTQVLHSPKGRAAQLNFGANKAKGDIFLFLHADTRLPRRGIRKIRDAVHQGNSAGRFCLQFDEDQWLLKFYATYTRFHLFSYGDQGFFVTRKLFEDLQGFSTRVPFEDVDFYKRLRKQAQPVILKESVITSARRFTKVGCLKQKFINIFLVGLYYLGIDMLSRKKQLYPDIR